MTDTLRTIDLSKRYGHTAVVDRLNLELPESSIYGLVGPNGAGKTTTIKMLMNILQPTEGRTLVLGTIRASSGHGISNTSATSPKTRRCRTG